MPSADTKTRKTARSKRNAKAKAGTKLEMFQKMLADQKRVREAIQNDIPLKELEKKYGYKFASLPDPKN